MQRNHRPPCRRPAARLLGVLTGSVAAACTGDAGGPQWAGSVDTLSSGRIVVTNPKAPLWKAGEAWTVTEDLRIGALDDPGPTGFGQIMALDVDALGRIWVLEGQAKEIRVFDFAGGHVRTVGRPGGGPGEFAGPADLAFGPDGRLWVADPQNNRVSVIDTTGVFVESHRMDGGFFMVPWPGGFDLDGRYYLPVPRVGPDGEFGIGIVRHGPGLVPLDTLSLPSDPVEREGFELTSENGRMMASIPFAPGFRTARSPSGTMWGLFTGEYRLFEIDAEGDTLRTIRNVYDAVPVTPADREAARAGLSWFTDQGGRIDMSKIPATKPAAEGLFVDDVGRIWVSRLTHRPTGQDYDLLDPDGRFLGRVELPVPFPRIRRVKGDYIYGVTQDELDVPYVVRGRIDRGGPGPRSSASAP